MILHKWVLPTQGGPIRKKYFYYWSLQISSTFSLTCTTLPDYTWLKMKFYYCLYNSTFLLIDSSDYLVFNCLRFSHKLIPLLGMILMNYLIEQHFYKWSNWFYVLGYPNIITFPFWIDYNYYSIRLFTLSSDNQSPYLIIVWHSWSWYLEHNRLPLSITVYSFSLTNLLTNCVFLQPGYPNTTTISLFSYIYILY